MCMKRQQTSHSSIQSSDFMPRGGENKSCLACGSTLGNCIVSPSGKNRSPPPCVQSCDLYWLNTTTSNKGTVGQYSWNMADVSDRLMSSPHILMFPVLLANVEF